MAVNDPSRGQALSRVDFPFQAKKPPFWKPAADRELTEQHTGGTRFLSTPFNTAGRSSPKEGLQEHLPKGNENHPGKSRGRANEDCFSAVFLVWTLLSLWLRKQACSHLPPHRPLLGVFFHTAGRRRSLVWLSSQSPPRPAPPDSPLPELGETLPLRRLGSAPERLATWQFVPLQPKSGAPANAWE